MLNKIISPFLKYKLITTLFLWIIAGWEINYLRVDMLTIDSIPNIEGNKLIVVTDGKCEKGWFLWTPMFFSNKDILSN